MVKLELCYCKIGPKPITHSNAKHRNKLERPNCVDKPLGVMPNMAKLELCNCRIGPKPIARSNAKHKNKLEWPNCVEKFA